jgi:hypothetical protein
MAAPGARVRAAIGNVSFFTKDLEKRIDAGLFRPMNHFGGSVRLRARRSIRRPRRKRDSELTERERRRKRRAERTNDLSAGEKVLNPWMPSQPNEPPRSASRILPESIYYAYDESKPAVFCGPIAFSSHPGEATGALERGGISRGKHVDARPFMKPAFDAALESGLGRFQNFIK